MFSFVSFLFKLLFNLFRSKKSLLVENSLYKKEIEILNRQKQTRGVDKVRPAGQKSDIRNTNLNFGP
jgi:hypothetical protein